jgi:hypothetical protein
MVDFQRFPLPRMFFFFFIFNFFGGDQSAPKKILQCGGYFQCWAGTQFQFWLVKTPTKTRPDF